MKLYRVLSIITIATVLLSACIVSPEKPVERPPLKIGWIVWSGLFPLVLGDEKGIFEKHGVEVEPVFYEQYTAGLADLQSGTLDGTSITLGDAALIEGTHPNSIRFIFVTDFPMEAEAIIASPEIVTVADLRGKKIGCSLGTYGELFVRQMLAENNLTVKDVELVNMPSELVLSAVAAGEIQAGHTWEPYVSDAVKQGNRVLYLASDQPGLIADGLAVQSRIAEERPEDVRAFVAAWFETLEWWQANPDEASAIISKHTGLTAEQQSTAGIEIFDLGKNQLAFAPGETTRSVYFSAGLYQQFLIQTGVVTRSPDVETLLDPSFLP